MLDENSKQLEKSQLEHEEKIKLHTRSRWKIRSEGTDVMLLLHKFNELATTLGLLKEVSSYLVFLVVGFTHFIIYCPAPPRNSSR